MLISHLTNPLYVKRKKIRMHYWRYRIENNSIPNTSGRYSDLKVFKSYIDLLSNLLHFERLLHVWNVHQKDFLLGEEDIKSQKKTKPKKNQITAEKEKEVIKTINSFESTVIGDKTKEKLKQVIPDAIFYLRIEKVNTSLIIILSK